ncbi:MAG: 50S ribosomal protein L23 [Candidatus Absconditabacterales bacterium]
MTFKQILQARAKKNTTGKVLKKVSSYGVILSPLVTEKTHKQQEATNKYSFKVHNDANKNDIKQAIEFLYKVHPESINIIKVVYKGRNQRKLVRKAYKKAIVTLSKKEKIELGS